MARWGLRSKDRQIELQERQFVLWHMTVNSWLHAPQHQPQLKATCKIGGWDRFPTARAIPAVCHPNKICFHKCLSSPLLSTRHKITEWSKILNWQICPFPNLGSPLVRQMCSFPNVGCPCFADVVSPSPLCLMPCPYFLSRRFYKYILFLSCFEHF